MKMAKQDCSKDLKTSTKAFKRLTHRIWNTDQLDNAISTDFDLKLLTTSLVTWMLLQF